MFNIYFRIASIVRRLLVPTNSKRYSFFLVADICLLSFSLLLAFAVRFDFTFSFYHEYQRTLFFLFPLFLSVKIFSLSIFGVYKVTWRYVSLRDIAHIFEALLVATLFIMAVLYVVVIPSLTISLGVLPKIEGIPRSIIFLDTIISFLLITGLRTAKRFYLENLLKHREHNGKRTIIIGAGNTGEMIARDLMRQTSSVFQVVGFLDDDQNKVGMSLRGVTVLGSTNMMKAIIPQYSIAAVIIALPSLDHKHLRKMYSTLRKLGVETVKIVPRIYEVQHSAIRVSALEDIKVEDLIGRQAIQLDYKEIASFLAEKTILITGAGGSIGAEITKQVSNFQPEKVILFDIDETALHTMEIFLKKKYPHRQERFEFLVGDIRDRERIEETMERYRPDIVFHAAAYKHVPLMEMNPREAIKTNIIGTYNVARAAQQCGAAKCILISTDKAVRPTGIMGATKRCAEMICRALNGTTAFVSVRFGNVLGSRGSVLPLFLEQLKEGGPLTVTHPDMRRYFMTIPEAVSLVLQASVMGRGGDVLVLDMGEAVRIIELAEELISLHGLEPYKDIDIIFTGLRAGEKLFEELLTAEEGTIATQHEKIFIAKLEDHYPLQEIDHLIASCHSLVHVHEVDEKTLKQTLRRWVRWYIPSDQSSTPFLNIALLSKQDKHGMNIEKDSAL